MTLQMKARDAMQLKIVAAMDLSPSHKATCSTQMLQDSKLAPSECVIHVQPSGLLPHAYVSATARICRPAEVPHPKRILVQHVEIGLVLLLHKSA